MIDSTDYDPSYITNDPYDITNSNGVLLMAIQGFCNTDNYINLVHLKSMNDLCLVANANKFKGAWDTWEYNFDKHDLIISFGREITRMQCFYDDSFSYPKGMEVVAVTFSDKHHGNKVFVYEIPQTMIVNTELMSPYFIGDSNDLGGWCVLEENTIDMEHARQAGYGDGK